MRINARPLLSGLLVGLLTMGAPADTMFGPPCADAFSADGKLVARLSGPRIAETVTVAELGGQPLWSCPVGLEPYKMLLSQNGQRLVMLDKYRSAGYGPEVVVIYGQPGEVVAQFSLEQLMTEEEIDHVIGTMTSRLWLYDAWIDEQTQSLVILGARPGLVPIPERPLQEGHKRWVIDLETGVVKQTSPPGIRDGASNRS